MQVTSAAQNPDNPFEPGEIIGQTEKGFGSVLGDVFAFDFPQWTVGAVFSYPLGRSTQKATYTRAKLAYTQQELALRSQELGVATEVRAIGRNVNTNRRRVDSTRAARVLTERQLEAAQKKFSVGLATSLDVLVAQRDLTNARNNELTAIIDYVKSLVDFEAVQEASTGGGDERPGRRARCRARGGNTNCQTGRLHSVACRSSRSRSSRRTRRRTSPPPSNRSPGPTKSSSSMPRARDDTVAIARRFTDRVVVARLARLPAAEEPRGVARQRTTGSCRSTPTSGSRRSSPPRFAR